MKKFYFLIIIFIFILLHYQNVNSEVNCIFIDNNGYQIPTNYFGLQRCTAGINSNLLLYTFNDTQNLNEWCWAASIQMIFEYYGHDISQARIVQETFGTIINMPAQPEQILLALNRGWTDDSDVEFQVVAETNDANPITASQDLGSDMPLIVGALGHAMVLTALTYNRDNYGNGQVIDAVVRDPWPSNGRRRSLTPQEWYNISFLARIRVN